MTPTDSPLLLGCDFTSAPSRRKPVTLATGRLDRGRLRLDGLERFETLDAWGERLHQPGRHAAATGQHLAATGQRGQHRAHRRLHRRGHGLGALVFQVGAVDEVLLDPLQKHGGDHTQPDASNAPRSHSTAVPSAPSAPCTSTTSKRQGGTWRSRDR